MPAPPVVKKRVNRAAARAKKAMLRKAV